MAKILKPYREIKFGDILSEEIEARNMTADKLAEESGLTLETVNELIDSKIRVSSDIAQALHKALDLSEEFWINLDANCQKTVVRYAHAPVRYIKEM
ncbi:MAG: helix-turn-helix domain-containing protein [Spirochaetales bacterium]|nr:helix-turn-helix domain-containing protein [Spirochaetales bacterium]